MEMDDQRPRRINRARIEERDGDYGSGRYLKKEKNRSERRRAKQDPECDPSYGKYSGWET